MSPPICAPRHQLRHQLAGPVHRVPVPAHRHGGVRRRRDRAARCHRTVERARRGVHRRRHRPLRRLVGGTHPGAAHRRRPAPLHRHRQRLPDPAAGHRQPRRSGRRACGSAPGNRPAHCTRPSPSTGRCASNWSTPRPARPAAAAPTTCHIPAAAPTTARPSTPWKPSRDAAAASRPPASRPAMSTCPTSGEAGAPIHRCGRAGHLGSAPSAYRSAVMALPAAAVDAPSRRARHRQPAGPVSHRAGPAGAVRRARRGAATGYDEFVDRGRQCPAGLAGARRMRRRARPRRTEPAAGDGAQPRRQRRHHLYPGRPARRRRHQRGRRRGAGAAGTSTRCRW